MTPKKPHDLDILNRPETWPLGPVMPVKRPSKVQQFGLPEIGLVIAGKSSVYLTNVLSLKTGMLISQLEGVSVHHYGSNEELLADGWVVD